MCMIRCPKHSQESAPWPGYEYKPNRRNVLFFLHYERMEGFKLWQLSNLFDHKISCYSWPRMSLSSRVAGITEHRW